jgi:hypothetical protein
MIEDSTILKRKEEILSSDMDGETVMMSVENSEYYSLSPVGTRIWEIVEKEISYKDLISQLMSEYSVDIETCKSDTEEFINELINKGLIELVN